jgi:hypothetical protein
MQDRSEKHIDHVIQYETPSSYLMHESTVLLFQNNWQLDENNITPNDKPDWKKLEALKSVHRVENREIVLKWLLSGQIPRFMNNTGGKFSKPHHFETVSLA